MISYKLQFDSSNFNSSTNFMYSVFNPYLSNNQISNNRGAIRSSNGANFQNSFFNGNAYFNSIFNCYADFEPKLPEEWAHGLCASIIFRYYSILVGIRNYRVLRSVIAEYQINRINHERWS